MQTVGVRSILKKGSPAMRGFLSRIAPVRRNEPVDDLDQRHSAGAYLAGTVPAASGSSLRSVAVLLVIDAQPQSIEPVAAGLDSRSGLPPGEIAYGENVIVFMFMSL